MVLYPNKMHVVTIEGTGINKLSDLKGKRVSTGSAGSGTEIMAFRVMEAAGIDGKKDIKQERLGAPSRSTRSRTARSTRSSGSAACPPRRHRPAGARPASRSSWSITNEVVDAMNKKYGPLYVKSVIPAGLLPGAGQAQCRGRRLEHLVTNDKMSDQMAYTHRQDAFREEGRDRPAVHSEAKNSSIKSHAPRLADFRSIKARRSIWRKQWRQSN
jgi:TRAP transporter TAXI family solute receptor